MTYENFIVGVWLVLCAIGVSVSFRQLIGGVKLYRGADNKGELILHRYRILTGMIGLLAFSVLVALAVTSLYLPSIPPPEADPLLYTQFRQGILRTELVIGFALVVALVSLPEFLDYSMRRYFSGVEDRVNSSEDRMDNLEDRMDRATEIADCQDEVDQKRAQEGKDV